MTVSLHTSSNLPKPNTYDLWFAVTGTQAALDPARRLADLGRKLEEAFDAILGDWWTVGRELGASQSGGLAHTPTGAAFISDFGQMLAWARLTAEAAENADKATLVLCDDPWLFRHLATLPGVRAGCAPVLWLSEMHLAIRGVLSRILVAARMFAAAIALKPQRHRTDKNCPVLLVYGHPTSTADGFDAYFGTMMRDLPGLTRVVHTDCPTGRVKELAANGRTVSLHAWGNPLFAFSLPFTRWSPNAPIKSSLEWLVRRAAVLENGGGALAMTRWQNHCQDRWLVNTLPISVSWSWENHPWERAFVRTARTLGVRTVGSQDTDVGRHQINMSANSNPDGLNSIPDVIICNGPAYRDELQAWGIPSERLVIGGSYRIGRFEDGHYDPQGPVFVALSAILAVSTEMMRAVEEARNGTRRFLVKEHPMYPFDFAETEDVLRTLKTLPDSSGICAVFYSTGLSGLEGIISGTPTLRLLPEDRIAIDTLPAICTATPVTINTLGIKIIK